MGSSGINGKAEEENGNGHTEETEEEEGNGDVKETEEEETTLKRKDAPTEVEDDSPKKKKQRQLLKRRRLSGLVVTSVGRTRLYSSQQKIVSLTGFRVNCLVLSLVFKPVVDMFSFSCTTAAS